MKWDRLSRLHGPDTTLQTLSHLFVLALVYKAGNHFNKAINNGLRWRRNDGTYNITIVMACLNVIFHQID